MRGALVALIVVGVAVAVGNFIIGRWYVGGVDLLGAGMWFVFYCITTFIQYRREEQSLKIKGFSGYD